MTRRPGGRSWLWLVGLASLAFAAVPVRADQVVVTFDDLVGQTSVPDGYGGINWGGVWTYYGWPQSPYTPTSPPDRVYTPSTGAGEYQFSFVTPDTTFQGAWFAGAQGTSVRFNLYDDGVLVHSTSDLFVGAAPVFLASGYAGAVDVVGVYSNVNDWFVMDNVTYVTSVPEPASALAAALGALGLLGYRWVGKRKRPAVAEVKDGNGPPSCLADLAEGRR